MLIQNVYSNFTYDDFKVEYWRRLLEQTPFEMAKSNLERYSLKAENTFPPHPGALAQNMAQQADGPYIPNAEETRWMLEQRDKLMTPSTPCPPEVKARLPWTD